MKTADVVIIGGGITGACAAYRLAERGAKNVVLVEQRHIASGPTGRSSGIVRQHYTIETLAAMARDSVKVFQNFADEIGGDAGFVQTGVVFLAARVGEDALKSAVAMHQRIGIRESIISGDEVKKMEPQLDSADIGSAAYEPDGGYADPALTANSFIEAAKRMGIEVMTRTRVQSLTVERERIAGVVTEKGDISTRVVINAAGPWGSAVAAMAGVEIPIRPTRHAVVILQRPAKWRTPTPTWIDLATGWYFKPERNASLMVGSLAEMPDDQKADIETYSTVPSYEETEAYSDSTVRRFPVMIEGLAQGGWAGLYDVTPDSQPVIDRIPNVEGFICAVGFSGHGFKLGPSTGRILAELALDGKCRSYDITPFRFGRFQEGKLSHGAYAYGIIG
jgi:sarcosine oxidase subunit beta